MVNWYQTELHNQLEDIEADIVNIMEELNINVSDSSTIESSEQIPILNTSTSSEPTSGNNSIEEDVTLCISKTVGDMVTLCSQDETDQCSESYGLDKPETISGNAIMAYRSVDSAKLEKDAHARSSISFQLETTYADWNVSAIRKAPQLEEVMLSPWLVSTNSEYYQCYSTPVKHGADHSRQLKGGCKSTSRKHYDLNKKFSVRRKCFFGHDIPTESSRMTNQSRAQKEYPTTPTDSSRGRNRPQMEYPTTPTDSSRERIRPEMEYPKTPTDSSRERSRLQMEYPTTPTDCSRERNRPQMEYPTTPTDCSRERSRPQMEYPTTPRKSSRGRNRSQKDYFTTPRESSRGRSRSQKDFPTTPGESSRGRNMSQMEYPTTPGESSRGRNMSQMEYSTTPGESNRGRNMYQNDASRKPRECNRVKNKSHMVQPTTQRESSGRKNKSQLKQHRTSEINLHCGNDTRTGECSLTEESFKGRRHNSRHSNGSKKQKCISRKVGRLPRSSFQQGQDPKTLFNGFVYDREEPSGHEGHRGDPCGKMRDEGTKPKSLRVLSQQRNKHNLNNDSEYSTTTSCNTFQSAVSQSDPDSSMEELIVPSNSPEECVSVGLRTFSSPDGKDRTLLPRRPSCVGQESSPLPPSSLISALICVASPRKLKKYVLCHDIFDETDNHSHGDPRNGGKSGNGGGSHIGGDQQKGHGGDPRSSSDPRSGGDRRMDGGANRDNVDATQFSIDSDATLFMQCPLYRHGITATTENTKKTLLSKKIKSMAKRIKRFGMRNLDFETIAIM